MPSSSVSASGPRSRTTCSATSLSDLVAYSVSWESRSRTFWWL